MQPNAHGSNQSFFASRWTWLSPSKLGVHPSWFTCFAEHQRVPLRVDEDGRHFLMFFARVLCGSGIRSCGTSNAQALRANLSTVLEHVADIFFAGPLARLCLGVDTILIHLRFQA